MNDWLKEDVDFLIESLKKDLKLISDKRKDVEWKRDHYRYTVTLAVQRIYNLLNTQITEKPIAEVQKTTKDELSILKNIINNMIEG